jgi:hypothetical protein
MLPCLGQRLAASPKQEHFDKFDEWKKLFAGGLRRELHSSAAYQGGPVRFSENIRRPAPFGREMPAKQTLTHPPNGGGVGVWRYSAWYPKRKVSTPRKPTAFPQASRKLN